MKPTRTPGRFNDRSMALLGIPDLPEGAFGGDLPPMQRKALVRAMGIRPQGGGGGLMAVVGIVAAIAIPFAAPAIVGAMASSTAIAASLPFVTAALSTTAGAVIGSAIVGAGLGAVTASVTGGNVGRGALMGAIGGGIGGYSQAGSITAQGTNVGTGATALTDAGTASLATTPTANAVVTNVGSNTGYWSPELGQFIDPMTGNTIAAQNIAYGGTVDSALASQLSQGGVSSQTLANSISSSGTLAVNTPGAVGGSAGAFGAGGGMYYDPTTAVAGSAPSYAQAGLQYTPAMEQAAANQAVQAGTMVNTPGTAATATTAATPAQTVQAGTAPAATGAVVKAAPATFSEALKSSLTRKHKLICSCVLLVRLLVLRLLVMACQTKKSSCSNNKPLNFSSCVLLTKSCLTNACKRHKTSLVSLSTLTQPTSVCKHNVVFKLLVLVQNVMLLASSAHNVLACVLLRNVVLT